jgi:hypothetical protein
MNGEKGQALPLAMMALAIGMLVITPFLGHASASVLGSRTYAQSITGSSACDAGVEHVIWSLTRGNLAEQLSQPGDHVTYQLGEPINGLTTSVTVTANVSGSATGDILDPVIDRFEWDTSNGYTPDIIRVSDNVYAIVYRGTGSRGYLVTISVDSDGNIGNSVIDTLIFDSSNGNEPSIINVSGNVYAIAYRGPGSNGFLKTISITAGGDIGNAVIDTLEYDTSNGYTPDIVRVSGNIFAIAYRGQGSDGFLKTASITPGGDIGNSAIDTLEYDTSNGYEPSIIHVSGNIYAIAYRGTGSNGFLVTVSITPGGDIGDVVIDTLEYDTSNGNTPDIIRVSGNIFAIAYRGQGSDGFLKTVSITPAGDIGNSVIDTLEYRTSNGYEPSIINVSGDIYAIACRGTGSNGFLDTVSIEANGDIGNSVIDSLEFDTSNGYEPCIIGASDGIFIIAYRGQGSDGFVTTVRMGAGGGSTYEILSSAGSSSIRAYVSVSGENATIVSWRMQ